MLPARSPERLKLQGWGPTCRISRGTAAVAVIRAISGPGYAHAWHPSLPSIHSAAAALRRSKLRTRMVSRANIGGALTFARHQNVCPNYPDGRFGGELLVPSKS